MPHELPVIEAKALINGEFRQPDKTHEVHDPFSGHVVGRAPLSSLSDLNAALDGARGGAAAMAATPGYERAELIRRIVREVERSADRIATTMSRETGKAIVDCRIEVDRSVGTLLLSAEEAIRIQGEHIPMDGSPAGAGKLALTVRFPVGVVAAVTPFNSPINLTAHKVGPALAAGNSVIIKPSPKAPLCVHLLAEAIVAAEPPVGAVSVLYGDEVSAPLVTDRRVDFVSFTGSIPVGKSIRASAGMKRMALELGGVGPTFVHEDADLAEAAKACARNGILLAGQSCVSVQNVYAHSGVHEEFLELMLAEVSDIRFGDPSDDLTQVGTLIDAESARRVSGMVDAALAAGAEARCGGGAEGARVPATVLTGVAPGMQVVDEEIFGPVLTVQPFDDPDPIFRQISDSPYGLQCGVFTNSIEIALKTFREVRTAGVILNGTSRWRSDQMPYGGVKESGIGKEGPKFAVRDMTEERLLVFNG